MTGTYALNLAPFGLYPEGEAFLGRYVEGLTGGGYDAARRKVFHNRKISKLDQEKINAYSRALSDAQVGHP